VHLRLFIIAVYSCLLAGSGTVNAVAQSQQATPSPALTQTIIVDGKEAEELWIVTPQRRFRFTAEIADEESERSSGLMFREEMATDHGMLFDFEGKRRIQMWMRNTPLSLDMIFTNETGKITRIVERTTPFSDAIIDSVDPVTHVFEVKAGVSRLIGLSVGDTIEHRLFQKD